MTSVAIPSRRIYSPVQKDAAIFLETVAESGGERTRIEVELAPGGGNRVHTHRSYSEHFEVLEGELTLRLGDQTLTLTAGETAVAPQGTLHCFSNPSGATTRFIVELRPGHRGFEQSLQIGYGLAEDGLTRGDGIPRNLLHLALLLEMSDMGGTGAIRAIGAVAAPLARLARRRGIDRELIERYCRY